MDNKNDLIDTVIKTETKKKDKSTRDNIKKTIYC